MPGQSSTADAKAIIRWSKLLTDAADFYGLIKNLAIAFQKLMRTKTGSTLTQPELFLCLVGYLSDPPRKWEGTALLNQTTAQGFQKLPGMGIALTSEFLRNLKWNGFKVDRHIKRLFGQWLDGKISVDGTRIGQLQALIGRRNKSVQDFLHYSML